VRGGAADARVRPGEERDLAALVEIYNHYVRTTHVTFDTRPFTPEERRPWFEGFSSPAHRLFVAEVSSAVVGYASIRDRTHWNSNNLVPQDPVTLGLCSQTDLDNEVRKAARRTEREKKDQNKKPEKAGTLLPTSETTEAPGLGPQPDVEIMQPTPPAEPQEESEAEQEARVLAKLQEMGGGDRQDD
jgi:hypothetical protein